MADIRSANSVAGKQQAGPAPGWSLGRRLAWLAVCVGAGVLVGVVGRAMSGDVAWFAAIPAAVAIGWLFVANPAECEPPGRQEPGA